VLLCGNDVPAGYRSILDAGNKALPIEEQTWRLHMQQKHVPACKKEKDLLLCSELYL